MRPDREWETDKEGGVAMSFSDGVWVDPKDKLFKMWYMGGYGASTCYATSPDGFRWEKPLLDVKPGTNVVQPDTRDSSTTWLDLLRTASDHRILSDQRREDLLEAVGLAIESHGGTYHLPYVCELWAAERL